MKKTVYLAFILGSCVAIDLLRVSADFPAQLSGLEVSFLSRLRFELRKKYGDNKGHKQVCLLYLSALSERFGSLQRRQERTGGDIGDEIDLGLSSQVSGLLRARSPATRANVNNNGAASLADYIDECIQTMRNQGGAQVVGQGSGRAPEEEWKKSSGSSSSLDPPSRAAGSAPSSSSGAITSGPAEEMAALRKRLAELEASAVSAERPVGKAKPASESLANLEPLGALGGIVTADGRTLQDYRDDSEQALSRYLALRRQLDP